MSNVDEIKEQLANTEKSLQEKKTQIKEAKKQIKETRDKLWKTKKELRQLINAQKEKTPGLFSRIVSAYRLARLHALKDAHEKYLKLTNQPAQPSLSLNETVLAQQLLDHLSKLETELTKQKLEKPE